MQDVREGERHKTQLTKLSTHAAYSRPSQNATHPSNPAPSATTSATLDELPSAKAAPSEAVPVADAEADAPVPVAVPVPVPPETPVGSLGCSAEVVVDSELRLLSVVVAESVAVVETEVDGKVWIGPPGLTLDTDGRIELTVNGSETARAWPAMAAEGARMRGSR